MKIVGEIPVSLEAEELIRFIQGASSGGVLEKEIEKNSDIFLETRKLIEPKALIKRFLVEKIDENHLLLAGVGFPFKSQLFSKIIPGAKYVELGLITIGNRIEKKASTLMGAGEHLKGFLFDSLGNLALGKTSFFIHSKIKEEAEKNQLRTSNFLSPGQFDWDVNEQKKFFSILPGEKVGINLNNSSLMIPEKSLSFLVGLGDSLDTGKEVCQYCSLQDKCFVFQFKKLNHNNN